MKWNGSICLCAMCWLIVFRKWHRYLDKKLQTPLYVYKYFVISLYSIGIGLQSTDCICKRRNSPQALWDLTFIYQYGLSHSAVDRNVIWCWKCERLMQRVNTLFWSRLAAGIDEWLLRYDSYLLCQRAENKPTSAQWRLSWPAQSQLARLLFRAESYLFRELPKCVLSGRIDESRYVLGSCCQKCDVDAVMCTR